MAPAPEIDDVNAGLETSSSSSKMKVQFSANMMPVKGARGTRKLSKKKSDEAGGIRHKAKVVAALV